MKKLLLAALLFCICSFCFAQSPEALQKIETAHIAFITQRIDLSPEEAKEFWPLYNEYTQKRRGLRKEYLNHRKQFKENQLTSEESEKLLNLGLQLKEQQLALDKTYSEKLTHVIGARKLLALHKAETDFRKLLLERLQKRKDKRKN